MSVSLILMPYREWSGALYFRMFLLSNLDMSVGLFYYLKKHSKQKQLTGGNVLFCLHI